ncbi:hypothetical protein pb186bvf_010450 [Paramecium bursaria]
MAITDIYQKYEQWKQQHQILYSGFEDKYRAQIYYQNLQKIYNHNSQEHTYQMAENQFMAYSQDEFEGIFLGGSQNLTAQDYMDDVRYPITQDWSNITVVKDQGQCSVPFIFVAVGITEAFQYFNKSGVLNLSEQQIVDCDTGNYGCGRSFVNYALEYVKTKGLQTNAAYPWKGVQGNCIYNSGPYKVTSYGTFTTTEDQLKNDIAKYPVGVQVNATNWQFYGGGIFSDCDNITNHAVMAVGYNLTSLKLKNSWGKTWGDAGYIHVNLSTPCGATKYSIRAQ